MKCWTGIVLALSGMDNEMRSRIPVYLHPIAGRPLVWHAVWTLCALEPRPERVLVITETPLSAELFEDLPGEVEVMEIAPDQLARLESVPHGDGAEAALVVDAAVAAPPAALQPLLDVPPGHWVGGGATHAGAASLDWAHLPELFRLPDPLHAPNGVLAADLRMDADGGSVIRSRDHLAQATTLVRDRLVRALMQRGATFLLPESVMVDVDVRIGRDTVIYPNVVLEGQTTIGEETVVGPGCRIIDSWIGSGVELKGWNYVSHTSVRNRAILEPNVRRGFD